jgi:hypothetical protein
MQDIDNEFSAIITASYESDKEVTDAVIRVRADIAHDMDISIMHDNCRGYL